MSRIITMFAEPFRLFFPLGTLFLLCGVLLWLPQIWNPGSYPVLLHRVLLLNGFAASFIGGFLMTAVPRFSKTEFAKPREVLSYLLVTLLLVIAGHLEKESWCNLLSSLQSALLLLFLFSRISRRKENPPYSFLFIFVGLALWTLSALAGALVDPERFKHLHYEGAIAAIVLGVGSRLIPGILGHVEIVRAQRESYEKPVPVLRTVPWYFFLFILGFAGSYLLREEIGTWVRSAVVLIVGLAYWRLTSIPKEKTALTWCLWSSGWLITLSFLLRALWVDGGIHANHGFFVNGIVLLSLLVATRVIQSHGPKDKRLEDWKGLFVMTFLVFLASVTRITAYLMPETYLTHLGYGSFVLVAAVLVWAIKYLPYIIKGKS